MPAHQARGSFEEHVNDSFEEHVKVHLKKHSKGQFEEYSKGPFEGYIRNPFEGGKSRPIEEQGLKAFEIQKCPGPFKRHEYFKKGNYLMCLILVSWH